MIKNVLIIIFITLLLFGVREHLHANAKSNRNFLENKGQITDQYGRPRTDIDLKIASGDVSVYIGSGQLHYQWAVPMDNRTNLKERGNKTDDIGQNPELKMDSIKIYRMDVNLLGANKNAQLLKENQQSYYERYFSQNSGTEGIRIAAYQKVIYKNIYPFIDWVLYIKEDKMEYDFVVHPGGKITDIRLQYDGSNDLKINKDGSFTAITPFGQVTEAAPHSFLARGEVVPSQFRLKDNILQFRTGDYTGILTIDPAVVWASYFGGSNGVFDEIYDVAVNKAKEVYAVGVTWSPSNIATTGAFQTSLNGVSDGFLFKLDSMQNILWATYYGGPGSEVIESVSLDSIGNIFLAGQTGSQSGISTGGSHQQNFGGGSHDIFMAKFDPKGSRLLGTYYGGDAKDDWARVKVLGSNVYLVGRTESRTGIATNRSYQPNLAGFSRFATDAFLVKFDLNGVREWATYYGGMFNESGYSVTGDPAGNIYLYGWTNSDTGIATVGSYQTNRSGTYDDYLVKFNNKGERQWGTYLGYPALGIQSNRNLDCDQAGNIYIVSMTNSTSGVATAGTHQGILAGEEDAVLLKFNSNGEKQWGTYFGGEKREWVGGVLCVDSNEIYLCGSTSSSTQITSPNAIQSVNMGVGFYGFGDVFLARFNHLGQNTFGSYYGGKIDEYSHAMAYDPSGYVYVVGNSNSDSAIATQGSFQDSYPGGAIYNGFIARFCFAPRPDLLAIAGPDTLCANNDKAFYTVVAPTDVDEYIWTLPTSWTGNSKTNRIDIAHGGTGGMVSVSLVRCADTSEAKYLQIYVAPSNPPVITIDSFTLGTVDIRASYQWLLNGVPIAGATARNYRVTENGDYAVITVSATGCIDTSEVYQVRNVSIANLLIQNHILIFPNPSHSSLLYITAPIPVSAALYSIDGRLLQCSSEDKKIDVADIKPGMYLIRINDQNGRLLKTEKWTKL